MDPKQFDPRAMLGQIGAAKNELITPKEYESKVGNYYERQIAQIYEAYQTMLQKNQSLDFDDLIMQTIHLFERVPEVLEYYQLRFQYIHVDEYQEDRKSTRLNSSHVASSYAVFCLIKQ